MDDIKWYKPSIHGRSWHCFPIRPTSVSEESCTSCGKAFEAGGLTVWPCLGAPDDIRMPGFPICMYIYIICFIFFIHLFIHTQRDINLYVCVYCSCLGTPKLLDVRSFLSLEKRSVQQKPMPLAREKCYPSRCCESPGRSEHLWKLIDWWEADSLRLLGWGKKTQMAGKRW